MYEKYVKFVLKKRASISTYYIQMVFVTSIMRSEQETWKNGYFSVVQSSGKLSKLYKILIEHIE